VIVQALLLVALFNAPALAPTNPGRVVAIFESVFLIVVQLAMPGFLLFVPEHGGSSLLVRVIAVIFDIAIYAALIGTFLWLCDLRKTSSVTAR
jgi:hypothetical protein